VLLSGEMVLFKWLDDGKGGVVEDERNGGAEWWCREW
jgi:hypothetical protein